MKGVLMTKMVQELNLTNLTPEIDLSEMRIMTAEINRPALQLSGYFEHFEQSRVQIIGTVEYTYLQQLDEKKKEAVLDDLKQFFLRLFSKYSAL